jgi:homoserine O-acetyltransferase
VVRDPNWNNGDYYESEPPSNGLALARMLGHLTYLSPSSFKNKFGRRLQDRERINYSWDAEFQVESYLRYQAEGFTKRFDANSYLWISKAMDYFSIDSFEGSQSEYLFACFTSDWFYPPSMSEELHQMAKEAGCTSSYLEVDLPYGHDAFLLDGEIQGKALAEFLADCR